MIPGRIEIGRVSEGLLATLPFGIGVTGARFHVAGTCPVQARSQVGALGIRAPLRS